MIDDSLRNAPVIDKDGYGYLIHPLTDGVPPCPPELLREWTAWAVEQPQIKNATILLAPEAMGIPLAAAIALATGIPYLVVRKRKYGLPGEEIAYTETGYSSSTLYLNGLQSGERVAIVDDVLSTGGTLDGLLATLAGRGDQVTGAVVFIDKGDAREQLEERHGVPIAVMRSVRVKDGRVALQ